MFIDEYNQFDLILYMYGPIHILSRENNSMNLTLYYILGKLNFSDLK